MMPLFRSVPHASDSHFRLLLVVFCCCQKQPEWFFFVCFFFFPVWLCWTSHTSPELPCHRSVFLVRFRTHWFDVSPAQNPSWRSWRSVISEERLFVSVSASISHSFCFSVHVLWRCLVQTGSHGKGGKGKRMMSRSYMQVFLALQGEKHNMIAPYLAPGRLGGHFSSISHAAVGTDILIFLHHTAILITLHQIVYWRREGDAGLHFTLSAPCCCLGGWRIHIFILLIFKGFCSSFHTIHIKTPAVFCFLMHALCSLVLQRFVGNVNSETMVQNKLSHPVRTRFLRFVPVDWNPSGWMGLRVEAFGCSYSE